MAVEYQFVMHNDGNIPSQKRLNTTARGFNGKVLAYQPCDDRTIGQLLISSDCIGALVTAVFNSDETFESFQAKLKRMGVHLGEERVRQIQ